MPSSLASDISALAQDVEHVVGHYDPAGIGDSPLSMSDIIEACHRIEGLREPEQRNIRDSLQAPHSGLESKISTKVSQIRASLTSITPNRGKALSVRHWRRLRWNVVDRPQFEAEIQELRTMVSLALSLLEEAVLSTSFSQPVIPTVAVHAPTDAGSPPIVPRGRFRVWPSSYTPETFRNAVAASPNGLEIPHSAYVITMEPFPSRNGGYANVYRGKWNELPIALKQLRSGAIAASSMKNFFNEVQVWCRLSHPNVIPFVGTYIDSNASMFMVAPWCENGDLMQFLRSYPQADRLKSLKQVGVGLTYLHKQKPCIVHGDLRGANILISSDHRAMLADFGLSKWVHDGGLLQETSPISAGSSVSTGLQGAGATPWMAPELLDEGLGRPRVTRETDVYAMGMLIIEVYTGFPPFYGEVRRNALHWRVVEGLRPRRPGPPADSRGFSEELWELVNRCWVPDPNQRTSIASVSADLNSFPLNITVTTVE